MPAPTTRHIEGSTVPDASARAPLADTAQVRGTIVAWVGVPGSIYQQQLLPTDLNTLRREFTASRVISTDDERIIGDALSKSKYGALTPEFVSQHREVLEKAAAVRPELRGVLSKATAGNVDWLKTPLTTSPKPFLESSGTMSTADVKASGPVTLRAAQGVFSKPSLTGLDYAQGGRAGAQRGLARRRQGAGRPHRHRLGQAPGPASQLLPQCLPYQPCWSREAHPRCRKHQRR